MRLTSALALAFCAPAAWAAGPVNDWVIQPTAGWDTLAVTLPAPVAATSPQLTKLTTNYYAGRKNNVRLATALQFYANGVRTRCTIDAVFGPATNALIADDFTAQVPLVCGSQQTLVALTVSFQYPVAATLFVEFHARPLHPTGTMPLDIAFKATLKHPGDNAPNAPTMTILELDNPGDFPVKAQQAFPTK